jgi:hypothetical protein
VSNELTIAEAEKRLQALPSEEGPIPGPRPISDILKLVKLQVDTQWAMRSNDSGRVNMEFINTAMTEDEHKRVHKFLHQLRQAAQGEFRWDGF